MKVQTAPPRKLAWKPATIFNSKMLNNSFITVLPLLFILSVHAWDPPSCNGIRVRKEWRTLSPDEQQTYLKAVKKSMDGPFYNAHSKLHGDLARGGKGGGYIHGTPHFLPWHRWFIWRFEEELRKDEKSIALPYWDTAFDSQAPELAPVWGDDMFGGNGLGDKGCVATGVFKDWVPQNPDPHCLKRKWDGGDVIGTFASPEIIHSVVTGTVGDYPLFRESIELDPHGLVHNNIGGDLRGMNSPNDPLFFLHHSNIDRYWWLWQASNPKNLNAYGGTNKIAKGAEAETKADKSDLLFQLPDNLKIKVEEMFDVKKLCYTYKDMSVDDAAVELPPAKTGDSTAGGGGLIRRAGELIAPLIKAIRPDDNKDTKDNKDDKAKAIEKVDPTIILEKATDAAAPLKPATKVEPIKHADPNVKTAVVKPVDDHVTVVKAPVEVHGSETDRKLLNKLRELPPITEEWAKLNNIDITQFRIQEKILQNFTHSLNKVHGYVSKAAFWNRHDMMIRIVEKKGADEFVCDVNGTRIVITKGSGSKTNPEQAASNIIGRVKESVQGKVQQPIAIVAENLAKVIGPPVTKDAKDATNPFAPRVEGEKGISKDSPTAKKLEEKIVVVPIKQLEKKVTPAEVKQLTDIAKKAEEKVAEKQEQYEKKTEVLAGKLEEKNKEEKEKKKEEKEEKKQEKEQQKEEKKQEKEYEKEEKKQEKEHEKEEKEHEKDKKKKDKKEEKYKKRGKKD